MKLAALIEAFLRWCGEHRSPATVKHYRGRLGSLRTMFGDRDAAEIRPLEIEAWLHAAGHWPDGRPKAPDTRRANAVALDRFQVWAIERKELSGKILDKIERPRGRMRERIPTPEEIAAILFAAPAHFRTIYQALRLCGARPNELARATIADWKREAGYIELKEHKTAAKTGKPRRIPVGSKLAEILEQSIGDRTAPGEPIFRNGRGTAWTPALLSRTFRVIRDRQRLPRDLVLYLARHEHASRICEAFGINAAAEALGHSNLATTKRYVKTSVETLRNNQDAVDLPGCEIQSFPADGTEPELKAA